MSMAIAFAGNNEAFASTSNGNCGGIQQQHHHHHHGRHGNPIQHDLQRLMGDMGRGGSPFSGGCGGPGGPFGQGGGGCQQNGALEDGMNSIGSLFSGNPMQSFKSGMKSIGDLFSGHLF